MLSPDSGTGKYFPSFSYRFNDDILALCVHILQGVLVLIHFILFNFFCVDFTHPRTEIMQVFYACCNCNRERYIASPCVIMFMLLNALIRKKIKSFKGDLSIKQRKQN